MDPSPVELPASSLARLLTRCVPLIELWTRQRQRTSRAVDSTGPVRIARRQSGNLTVVAPSGRRRVLRVPNRTRDAPTPSLVGFGTSALELVERPHVWNDRIIESIELGGGRVRRRIAREVIIPFQTGTASSKERTQMCFIPLFRRRKGALLDNLDLDEPSEGTTTLSFRQSQQFGSVILVHALEEELRREPPPERDQNVEDRLFTIPFLSEKEARNRYESLFEPSNERIEPNSFQAWLQANIRIQSLAKFLVTHYFLIAQVEACAGKRVSIRYSYDSAATQQGPPSSNKFRQSVGRLQEALGQRPTSFVLGIPLAFDSNSYHFRMAAPLGHYVDRLALYQRAMADDREQAHAQRFDPSSGGVMCLGLDRHSTTFVHVYLRGMADLPRFPFYFQCNFYELPPSVAFNAGVVSALLALPLLIFAGALDWLLPAPALTTFLRQDTGTDFLAVVLALPGTVAIWLRGFSEETDLVRTQLLARMAPLMTGALSYLSAVSFIMYKAQLKADSSRFLNGWDRLWWWALALASATLTFYLFGRVYRVWATFVGRIQHRSSEDFTW